MNYKNISDTKLENASLIQATKLTKILTQKTLEKKVNKSFLKTLNIQNVLISYKISKMFNLKSVAKQSWSHIESCFTILAETKNFLELEYILVAKVFASSELHITSELEIYNSVKAWLNYNVGERKKHAKQLLIKVRFALLSDHALEKILKETSLFTEEEECFSILKDVIKNKHCFKDSSCYRYCSSNNFNLFFCGGFNRKYKVVRTVEQICGTKLKSNSTLPSMDQGRGCHKCVCIKDEVFVIGGIDSNLDNSISIVKYSAATKSWTNVCTMDYRKNFCLCAFMDEIFVYGGTIDIAYNNIYYSPSSTTCVKFNTKKNEWTDIARMNEAVSYAACAVYQNKIIVCGGHANGYITNSANSYDPSADEWNPMPNMVTEKVHHSAVVVKNKLFVVSRYFDELETFDSINNMFVSLKLPLIKNNRVSEVVSMGNKFYVFFQSKNTYVLCYDIDENKWCRKSLKCNTYSFSCVKVPWF